jgi:hypothetical protein
MKKYDMMADIRWGGELSKSDFSTSKSFLLDLIMKKCNISEEDLHDIDVVKSKVREANIDEILK